jgi:hypothetical protein
MAQTLAERYSQKGTLGATFFFDKASPQRNNPSYLVTTLAAQLASSIPGFGECISHVVETEGPGIFSKTQEQLSEKIIVEPFRSLKAADKAAKEAAEKAEREAAEEARREAAEKAEREAAKEARREAAEKAEREAAKEARREAAEKAQREAAEKDAEQVAGGSGGHIAEEAAEKAPPKEPVGKSARKFSWKAAGMATRKVAQKAAGKARWKATGRAATKATERAAEEAGGESAGRTTGEAAGNAAGEVAEAEEVREPEGNTTVVGEVAGESISANRVKMNITTNNEAVGEPVKEAAGQSEAAATGAEWKEKKWIIIDALDACVAPSRDRQEPNQADPQKAQLRVLKLIYSLQSRELPLSFLIFARPETWTMNYCKRRSGIIEMVDVCAFASHMKDIETLLRVRLGRIGRERRRVSGPGGWDTGTVDEEELEGNESEDEDAVMSSSDEGDENWPGEDRIRRLVDMTRGNMLSASDVIKRIEKCDGDLEDQLNDLLENGLRTEPAPEQHKVGSKTSTSVPESLGQFNGATINAGQFGCTTTTNNNTFNQSFQPGSTPQFTYSFNFGPGRPSVNLVENSGSNDSNQRFLETP